MKDLDEIARVEAECFPVAEAATKQEFDGGGKIMEKEKKQKIRCICFLLASICFFIVSIVNFMDKNTTPAIPYLLLGISFFLLSTTNLRKNK